MLGQRQDELNPLLMTECLALNPTVYSVSRQPLNAFNEVKSKINKTIKSVSQVVVENETNHDDYVNVIETNEALKKNVVSIRTFSHQLYTFKQPKKEGPDIVLRQDAHVGQHQLHPIWL